MQPAACRYATRAPSTKPRLRAATAVGITISISPSSVLDDPAEIKPIDWWIAWRTPRWLSRKPSTPVRRFRRWRSRISLTLRASRPAAWLALVALFERGRWPLCENCSTSTLRPTFWSPEAPAAHGSLDLQSRTRTCLPIAKSALMMIQTALGLEEAREPIFWIPCAISLMIALTSPRILAQPIPCASANHDPIPGRRAWAAGEPLGYHHDHVLHLQAASAPQSGGQCSSVTPMPTPLPARIPEALFPAVLAMKGRVVEPWRRLTSAAV